MERVGTVERQTIAQGSKSERSALVLKTSEGDFVLRRIGADPFQDSELEKLIGQTVQAEGEVTGGYAFLARSVTPVEHQR